MKAPRFIKWFAGLPKLNQPQRLQVLDALRPAAGLHQVLALIEQVRSPGRRCPHCQSQPQSCVQSMLICGADDYVMRPRGHKCPPYNVNGARLSSLFSRTIFPNKANRNHPQ